MLIRIVAFDEVAAHDVQWGAESVNWLSKGKVNEHKQAYVSRPRFKTLPGVETRV